MHIKRFTASIDQYYLSIYKELQQIKSAKKGLLNDYSQKIISFISRLQDKSSEFLSQISSVTKGVCTHKIPLQYMINHISAQSVENLPRAIQQLLKKVQFLSRETITRRI